MQDAPTIIPLVTHWFAARPDVAAIALVGSVARGTARPDSDIDLVLLVHDPQVYRRDQTWPAQLPWQTIGATVQNVKDEDYGALWARFVTLSSGRIIEFGFAAPSWAQIDPVDAGTRRVVADGCRVLYDPRQVLARLIAVVNGYAYPL